MAADGIGAPTDPSRWRDAREWFQKHRPAVADGAPQTHRDAQARAFRVAGITSVNLVTEVHQAIDDAIANGTTLDDFKKRVGAKLAEEWGAPNARRVETIFRTNVQSAYNAGRWAEMNRPAVLAVRPFWKYVAILDGRTTATCAPLNGVIRRHDDDFWKEHFPPLHFNCRSTVVSLSRGEAERAGGVKDLPKADKPGEGFGTRPDLAGDDLELAARASRATKSAYSERQQPSPATSYSKGHRVGTASVPNPAAPRVPPEAEARHPDLVRALGEVLRVEDFGSAVIQEHVSDLQSLHVAAPHLLPELRARGLREVHIAHRDAVDLDGNPAYADVPVAGLGQTLREAEPLGIYNPVLRTVSVGMGTAYDASVAIHEMGHAVGHLLGFDDRLETIEAHQRLFDRLDEHSRIGGAGSFEGRREFFAESLSVLITFGTEEALLRYDAEWISFLKHEVLRR